MNSDIQGLNDIIHSTFKNLKVQDLDRANTVTDLWSSVLKNINSTGSKSNPNEGQNLADHSRVIDLKNGVLLVEADHPGWISLLQMHQKFIIRGMNMKSPDLKISTIAFRLKGNRGTLGDVKTDSVEKIKEDMSKKLDKENEILNQKNPEFTKKSENLTENVKLPPELAAIFADLKQSMLTNSENK